MEREIIEIKIYDKRSFATFSFFVTQLSENQFRLEENDPFNPRLNFGTVIQTWINPKGLHQITRIIKESEFITRRFLLSSGFKESEFRQMGDEIVKRGGSWQVDMGGIATVNIPPDYEAEFDRFVKEHRITEFTDDE